MADPTKRDLQQRLNELETDGADEIDAEEAYALLVGVACGTATEEERERWRRVPESLAHQLVGSSEGDA